jgi:hypothetical protein
LEREKIQRPARKRDTVVTNPPAERPKRKKKSKDPSLPTGKRSEAQAVTSKTQNAKKLEPKIPR